MAINFLNTVAVDENVLFVDTVNDRVGIGTDNPSAKLDVVGSALAEQFKLSNTTADATTKYGALMGRHYTNSEEPVTGMLITSNSSATGQTVSIGGGISAANAVNSVVFYTAANNTTLTGTERMRISSNGNVGIGTTSPSGKLDIQGDDFYTDIEFNLGVNTNRQYKFTAKGFAGSRYNLEIGNSNSGNTYDVSFVNDGNVGIGTTSPETTLSVVGATSTNNLIGGSINLATSSGWVIPSGAMSTRVGYYGGDFTLNGVAAENGMEWGLGPFNDRQLLWTTTGSTDSDGDGGWNKTLTNLDIESPYLSVVYFKRVSSNTSGTFYHGTGSNILNLDGTSNTNPYFVVRALSGLDQNVWYVSIGVIQSNSDSNTTAYTDISGLYRLDTGVKVANANTFKFASTGATLNKGHRAYLFYSTDVDVVAQFANPGFYKIDGDQPKLHDILGDYNDDVFWSANGDDIYNDNSGNVGIGTTTPDTKLDVEAATNPTIRITNSTSALGAADVGSLEFFTKDASTDASRVISSIVCVNDGDSPSVPDGQLVFKTALGGASKEVATERMRIDSAGNVGIGTTTPAYTLQVGDGTEDSVITAFYSDAQYTRLHGYGLYMSRTASYIRPLTTTTQTLYIGAPSQIWNAISHDANTCSFSTGGTEHMRITSAGRVGIGTTSPAFTLDLGDSTNANNLFRLNGLNADVLFSGNTTAPSGGVGLWNFINTGTNATTRFYVQDANNSNSRLTFDFKGNNGAIDILSGTSSGNVGIGTTSPESNLEISDSTQATGATLSITNAHNGSWVTGDKIGSIDFRIDDASATQLVRAKIHTEGKTTGTYPSSSHLVFSTANVNTLYERMRIDSAGNVGIGTDSPTAKLQVNGNITSTYNAADTDTGAYGISRTLSGLTVNARGYRDDTVITAPGANTVSYAGIDLKSQSTSGTYDHVTMFQGRHSLDAANLTDFEGLYIGGLNFTNSSSATNYVGVTVENPTSFSGTITNFIGTKINAPARTGGTITNFYGLKIEDSVSATNKWSVYSEDTSVKSKMLGQLESGDISVYNTGTNASLNLNSSSTASGGNYIHAKKSDGSNQWVIGSNNASDERLTLKQYNAANIIFQNNSGDAMVIDTGGDVGIGTTSPGYKLDVSGTGRFTSTVTATNFILSSDKRKKNKIKDLICDNIDVNWKSFELKESEGEYRTGVIAQELEELHPEFVNTDKEGFKSVKYIDLLIAKIAELEARLDKAGI